MAAVGFEPTPPGRLEPGSSALDRSAMLPHKEVIGPSSRAFHVQARKRLHKNQEPFYKRSSSNINTSRSIDRKCFQGFPATDLCCAMAARSPLHHQPPFLHWPGIEPGSTAWQAAMLSTIPPMLEVQRKMHSVRHLLVPLGERFVAWTKCVS